MALGYEELAYATYVYEYSTGRFDEAKDHAEKSLDIMTELLPNNHLLLASSQRVLALILEEIAIDHVSKDESRVLLRRAEELHLSALSLAVEAFGEMNVQTAKHYGNLGRLYQVKFNMKTDIICLSLSLILYCIVLPIWLWCRQILYFNVFAIIQGTLEE